MRMLVYSASRIGCLKVSIIGLRLTESSYYLHLADDEFLYTFAANSDFLPIQKGRHSLTSIQTHMQIPAPATIMPVVVQVIKSSVPQNIDEVTKLATKMYTVIENPAQKIPTIDNLLGLNSNMHIPRIFRLDYRKQISLRIYKLSVCPLAVKVPLIVQQLNIFSINP